MRLVARWSALGALSLVLLSAPASAGHRTGGWVLGIPAEHSGRPLTEGDQTILVDLHCLEG